MEKESSCPHLPEAIIEEILSRLPVKSLLIFRCVSKLWGSLIGSKRFIKTQYQNSIKNPSFPQQRVIIRNKILHMSDRIVQCSLLSVLSEPTNTIPLFHLDDPTKRMRLVILGCYNGLLYVLDRHGKIQLWNPSTRISKCLPENSNYDYVSFGFGWDESSGEYKVFALSRIRAGYDQWKWVGNIYSSKTKLWKTIKFCDDLRSCHQCGLFAGGKLYWHTKGNNKDIIFLDLNSEVFGRIEFPFDQEYCDKKLLGVLGGCLCVLHYEERGVRVWVMKEVWEKVVTLSHLNELLQPPLISLNGDILVDCRLTLLVYNPRDNVFRVPEVCVGCTSHVYVGSLVSPEDV